MIENEVVECLNYTLSSDRDAELNGPTAKIASGLSALVRSTSFIEYMASKYLKSGGISIGLYAFARSGKHGDVGKLFTIFGPTPTRGGDRGNIRGSAATHPVEAHPAEVHPAEEDVLEHSGADDDNNDAEGNVMLNAVGNPNGENDAGRGDAVRAGFSHSIPEEMMVKCMSFCLDMSGSTSHPRNYSSKDLENVNAKKLSKAVKAIFKKYKDNLNRRGMKTHGLQYLSLLPSAIRRKEITVPLVRLCPSESGSPFTRTGSIKVNLNISKADSNSKDQNIALVANLLHHRNHGVEVEEILARYANIGVGPDGCKRNSLCRAGRLKCCCPDGARDVCELYKEINGERKIVGKGVVDPYTAFLFGSKVPESFIVVRVKTITEVSAFEERTCEDGTTMKMNAYVWPKRDVDKVQLLGDLGDVLATGIFVQEFLLSDRRKPNNTLDISFAVFVCEVEIEEGMKGKRYPFSDWYKSTTLRKLGLAFLGEGQNIPENLEDVCRECRKAILWHRNFLRRGGNGGNGSGAS